MMLREVHTAARIGFKSIRGGRAPSPVAEEEAGHRMHIQVAIDEFGIAAARPRPYRMRQSVEQHNVAANKC
jgi:hypothetical protein